MTLSPEHIMAIGGIVTGLVGAIFPQFQKGRLQAMIREECAEANKPLTLHLLEQDKRLSRIEAHLPSNGSVEKLTAR
jgi:hypothetical protein